MPNDDNEKWELPPNLRMDNPVVAAQAEQMRSELSKRAVSPFARLSPTEFAKIRAHSRIEHLTRSLRLVEKQLQESKGREEHHNLHEAQNALRARLAENLAIIGNYGLAAEIEPDPAKQLEYAQKIRRELFEHM